IQLAGPQIRVPNLEKNFGDQLPARLLECGIEKLRADSTTAHVRIDGEVRDLALTTREPRDNITEQRREATAVVGDLTDAGEVDAWVRQNVAKRSLGPRIGEGSSFDRRDRRDVTVLNALAYHHVCDTLLASG